MIPRSPCVLLLLCLAFSGNGLAQTITSQGIDAEGNPFVTFQSAAGESYVVQSSADLGTWTSLATLSGTGAEVTYTDAFTGPGTSPRKILSSLRGRHSQRRLARRGRHSPSTRTWHQEPMGFDRTADVLVPAGAGPVILLHGSGGSSSFISNLNPHLNNVIRVAPNGYVNQWNIGSQNSEAPDVDFMRQLIDLIKSHDNVDAGKISIAGNSNGAGMTNRLLIELDGAAFQRAACRVFSNDRRYVPTTALSGTTPSTTLTIR